MQTFKLLPDEQKHLEQISEQSFVVKKKAIKMYGEKYNFSPDKAMVTTDWNINAEPLPSKEPVQRQLDMKLNSGENAVGNFYDPPDANHYPTAITKENIYGGAPGVEVEGKEHPAIENVTGFTTESLVLAMDADEKGQLAKFDKLEVAVAAVVAHLKGLEVTDEVSNTVAVDIATKANKLVKTLETKYKELAQPLQKEVAVYMGIKKKLSEPIESAILETKQKITAWTQEQERLRKLELQRQEEAKRKEEQDRENERQRVLKIRTQIDLFKTKSAEKINAIEDLTALDAFVKELKAWSPKQEFYQEFFTELESEMKAAMNLAEGRRPLIEQMEKQKALAASANKKAAAAAAKEQEALRAKMELKRKNDELEAEKKRQQAEELEAANKIAVRNTMNALGWPADRVDGIMADIFHTYQNYTNAMAQIEKVKVFYTDKLRLYNDGLRTVAAKATNQRVNWKFRIADATKVPREYLMVDEAKIKAALTTMKDEVKAGTFSISGVEFYDEASTVLK